MHKPAVVALLVASLAAPAFADEQPIDLKKAPGLRTDRRELRVLPQPRLCPDQLPVSECGRMGCRGHQDDQILRRADQRR